MNQTNETPPSLPYPETLVVSDANSALHTVPRGFPERPQRISAAVAQLESLVRQRGSRFAPLQLQELPSPVAAALAERARSVAALVHDPLYIERWEAAVAAGDRSIDTADNPLSAGTASAAWGAVQSALAAVHTVYGKPLVPGTDTVRHAFSLARPPGHHCERDRAMGFCYLNQVAIAAQELIADGRERVAIVDFDVHHGNGTQHLFESRADVLYVSLHQWPFYPGTGSAGEIGTAAGEGATLNVPLPAGTGDAAYAQAVRTQVLPALERWQPQALLISAGFDAWKGDPLGGMKLTRGAFFELGRTLRGVAERCCGGGMVSVLEGGYDLAALGTLIGAYLAGAAGQGLEVAGRG